ncbi:MAG TPA: hypothetical protein PK156_24360 [Polyangium sp.]|nr:hypothetical protein [Polyangium sp.]
MKKRLDEINMAALDDARIWFDEFMNGIHTLGTIRQRVPHLAEQIDSILSRPDSRYRRRS